MEGTRAKASPPPTGFLRQCVRIDQRGVLVWRSRPKTHFSQRLDDCARWRAMYAGKPAGSRRPDQRLVVSVRWRGRLFTLAADRVAYLLASGEWPHGRVTFADGDAGNLRASNLVDQPRRAKSPGRRGGKAAEAERDRVTLATLAEEPSLTVSALAARMALGRSNVSRRLRRLMGKGLTEAVCVPGRAHWLVTAEGRERVEEADLIDEPPPPPTNGSRWLKPLRVVTVDGPCGSVSRFG